MPKYIMLLCSSLRLIMLGESLRNMFSNSAALERQTIYIYIHFRSKPPKVHGNILLPDLGEEGKRVEGGKEDGREGRRDGGREEVL